MGLHAVKNNKHLYSFQMSNTAWQQIVNDRTDLLLPCCKGQAIPKTLQSGERLFSHAPGGLAACSWKAIAPEHDLYLLHAVKAVIDNGWRFETQVRAQKACVDIICRPKEFDAKIAFMIETKPNKDHRNLKQENALLLAEGYARVFWVMPEGAAARAPSKFCFFTSSTQAKVNAAALYKKVYASIKGITRQIERASMVKKAGEGLGYGSTFKIERGLPTGVAMNTPRGEWFIPTTFKIDLKLNEHSPVRVLLPQLVLAIEPLIEGKRDMDMIWDGYPHLPKAQ